MIRKEMEYIRDIIREELRDLLIAMGNGDVIERYEKLIELRNEGRK